MHKIEQENKIGKSSVSTSPWMKWKSNNPAKKNWNKIVKVPRAESKMPKLKVLKKTSTSMPYICQDVQDSFSKLLKYEAWKEICHFLHWAVISSHPGNRNGTDPFILCLMLFIVQEWDNLKNAKHEKFEEKKFEKKISKKKFQKKDRFFFKKCPQRWAPLPTSP